MKLTLKIEIGNDGMQTAKDIADAISVSIQGLGGKYAHNHILGVDSGIVCDIYGNTVGKWQVSQ